MVHMSMEQRDARRGFAIAGIPIRIDPSWLLIFALVLWTLSTGYLPSRLPQIPRGQAWLGGLLATACFFASLVFHELAHALVARRAGISVSGIRLFLFGGVSQIGEEPRTPAIELRVALVGPLASFVLAAGFWVASLAFPSEPPSVSVAVLQYLAWINAGLGLFNLLPGFPLDGGRVLRALVWRYTGSLQRATHLASNLGRGFALGLMLIGAFQMYGGALVGGLWFVLIGLFLRSLARAPYQELVLRNALQGVDVAQVMVRTPLRVSPDLTLRALVDERFLRDGVRAYPVCEGERVLGAVSLDQLRAVPAEQLASRRVRDVMTPLEDGLRIAPSDSLLNAIRKMALERLPLLLVMEGERLAGILTRGAVQRVVEVRRLLAPEASASHET
jgi:Zn-dependent protease/CBS domain-containing protein